MEKAKYSEQDQNLFFDENVVLISKIICIYYIYIFMLSVNQKSHIRIRIIIRISDKYVSGSCYMDARASGGPEAVRCSWLADRQNVEANIPF